MSELVGARTASARAESLRIGQASTKKGLFRRRAVRSFGLQLARFTKKRCESCDTDLVRESDFVNGLYFLDHDKSLTS